MKKILVTGAAGFVGRNIVAELSRFPELYTVFQVDINTENSYFEEALSQCDFIIHLAGVNRPTDDSEFQTGNADLTWNMVNYLLTHSRSVPIAMTSSIQAELDNPYGRSKRQAEQHVFQYRDKSSAPVYIFRMPNIFGKWSRPNYNSAVATFCYNIAHGLPITVRDPAYPMSLIYIDDVIGLIMECLQHGIMPEQDGFCRAKGAFRTTLGEIASKIQDFGSCRNSMTMPCELRGLDRALYSTYLSYLEYDQLAVSPITHGDARGIFAELFKTFGTGQFSVSTTVPGVTRGNHWHHSKTEKFIVVAGNARIRLRRIDEQEIYEILVSGDKPQIVDIPPGTTHSIENISEDQTLVTLIWASELFDHARPDTNFMEV